MRQSIAIANPGTADLDRRSRAGEAQRPRPDRRHQRHHAPHPSQPIPGIRWLVRRSGPQRAARQPRDRGEVSGRRAESDIRVSTSCSPNRRRLRLQSRNRGIVPVRLDTRGMASGTVISVREENPWAVWKNGVGEHGPKGGLRLLYEMPKGGDDLDRVAQRDLDGELRERHWIEKAKDAGIRKKHWVDFGVRVRWILLHCGLSREANGEKNA